MGEHRPSEAREPSEGTRFKAGRRPAVEASINNGIINPPDQ